MTKEQKANRPRIPRDQWLAQRGNGGNIGRFYDERSRFVHVSQWYQPEHDEAGRIVKFTPQYLGLDGRPLGRSYVKEQEATA